MRAVLLLAMILAGCTAPTHLETPSGQGQGSLRLAEVSQGGNATLQPGGATSQAFQDPMAADSGQMAGSAQAQGGEGVGASESAQNGAYIQASEDRDDVSWGAGRIYLRALTQGVHYNLNQPAKAADSLADDWSLVFHEDAPFRAEDTLWFCGPDETIQVQIWDQVQDLILYDGQVQGVEACS